MEESEEVVGSPMKYGDEQDNSSYDNSESTESGGSAEIGWIAWFVSLSGNDFFCEVDEEYIEDDFNLTGLNTMVPYYEHALDLILDGEIPLDNMTEEQQEVIETAAEVLYGLIHARFILTSRGMQKMYEKYHKGHFGRCPRVFCQGQYALPVSLSDVPRNYSVNLFCPKCQDLFYPRSAKQANIDGAYFGTTFAHLFLLSHNDVIPTKSQQTYIPRIYGFKIHKQQD
jgi:casein kinase II subunit beta